MATILAVLPTGILVAGVSGATPIPVSISVSADPVDAGLPFELTANVPGSLDEYFYNWTDSQGGSDGAPTWEVDCDSPGNLTVSLVVTDPAGDRGTATLTVSIVPPPSLTVSSPISQVDAGVPAPFFVDVVGGVPPLTASWIASSGGPNGSAGWPSDGNYSELVTFSTPGPAWILVRVVDGLGDSSSTAEYLTEVVPGGSVSLFTNGSVGEVGWPLGAVVVVENGAPPFRWALSSSLPITGGTAPFGLFPADGTYPWSLPFDTAGTAYLNLTVVDALGAVATAATVVAVEPPLSVNLTSGEGDPGFSVTWAAAISGGLPPYSYQFRLSDGAEANGTLVAPGLVRTSFGSLSPGNYSIEVRVTDGLGHSSVLTQPLRVGVTPSSAPSEANDFATVGGILALTVGALIAGFWAFLRRRRTSHSLPSMDTGALPVVRQLMEQSQVIDRDTLLLLGEEEGESVDAIQVAITTLIRTGEVTTEVGPGSDEVLRWKGAKPSTTPPEAAS